MLRVKILLASLLTLFLIGCTAKPLIKYQYVGVPFEYTTISPLEPPMDGKEYLGLTCDAQRSYLTDYVIYLLNEIAKRDTRSESLKSWDQKQRLLWNDKP